MPLTEDISYYIESLKKKFNTWWMYLPYQQKIMYRLLAGGAGILAAIYLYLNYGISTTSYQILAGAIGLASILVFIGGVKDAL